jgi:hypothetical protein
MLELYAGGFEKLGEYDGGALFTLETVLLDNPG